ncbi:hypothetical protein NDU88_006957 [Pleurodeles waltl]|uniref:Uncharacterized protein n=1 Tax=Pleurodeles waltl TaxID=8319 RepID=A0AAV7UMJ2_PLEWA|nr:hypothetical protein NDU88_006957 [Pleurodeles waltl]
MSDRIEFEAVIFESMASRRQPTAVISWSMHSVAVSERASDETAAGLGTTRATGEAIGGGREIASENSSCRVCLPVVLPVSITKQRGDPDYLQGPTVAMCSGAVWCRAYLRPRSMVQVQGLLLSQQGSPLGSLSTFEDAEQASRDWDVGADVGCGPQSQLNPMRAAVVNVLPPRVWGMRSP